ncbi:DUF1295 domain-containing protein [Phytomonospora endophytica]|uniref:Steroid 5-alpha reductase family enzyme n=1 Tax=Phytomonospora endophytica TaxID=714109 RepID=A0A841FXZ4_9ACTN|nr:DUF1295 domain-containing protein [Phytomonospora endophytica]MBB6038588.1 steroid 5-alpha reductase family enzyme [Phytomonospora endophytica]GIG69269.1 membrane protein [Phytomonospora endophytica]
MFSGSAFAANLLWAGVAALAVLLIAFAVGSAIGKHRVVDVAWGAAFAAIAVVTFVMSDGHGDATRRALVAALTVVWGVRLSVHIAWRSRGAPEDARYERLLSKARGNRDLYALRMVYLLQAVLAWFISLPVQVASYDTTPASWWLLAGVAVWLLGMFFEAVGDAQLERFRRDPASRGKVLDTGLWRYTRHPNYFGDACVWWGLYLIAASTGWQGAATVVAPLVMTYFLAAKTGKPLMEQHLSHRAGYAEYVRRTSGFVPWPPRGRAGP